MISLRTPRVPVRPTVLPKLRDAVQAEHGSFTLRTRLDVRPGSRLIELAPRDTRMIRELGFPMDREIAQPREWRGRVEGPGDNGWWMTLVEAPSGMEIHAHVETSAFGDVTPSVGVPVIVHTWFEWRDGAWTPRRAVARNVGA